MDLCSDMLVKHAPQGETLEVSLPKFKKILGYFSFQKARNFDRWYNRWRVYPRHVAGLAGRPGFFHIVDHSYSQLSHSLPSERVGIYCHDLDAFKCLTNPDTEPRPEWYKMMMRQVRDGFVRARIVFCSTEVTRNFLMGWKVWDPESIHVVPYGIAEEFKAIGRREPGDYLLHVGSCIPRKRIDLLLDAFRLLSLRRSSLTLIQAGGEFTPLQLKQIRESDLSNRVSQRRNLSREDLASLYRGARCLLVTSDAEGFGLPVIEGLACGTRVVSSDIPSLREVGEGLVGYFPPGDSKACADATEIALDRSHPVVSQTWLKKWQWRRFSERIFQVYKSLEGGK